MNVRIPGLTHSLSFHADISIDEAWQGPKAVRRWGQEREAPGGGACNSLSMRLRMVGSGSPCSASAVRRKLWTFGERLTRILVNSYGCSYKPKKWSIRTGGSYSESVSPRRRGPDTVAPALFSGVQPPLPSP